jgi:hypothetical protein
VAALADEQHADSAVHAWQKSEPQLYEDMLRSFVTYHELNSIRLEHATWVVNIMFVFILDLYDRYIWWRYSL